MDKNGFIKYMCLKENAGKTIKDSVLTLNDFFKNFELFNPENMLQYKKNYLLNYNYNSGTVNKKIGHLNKYSDFKNICFPSGSRYKLKYVPYTPNINPISLKEYSRFVKIAYRDNEDIYLISRLIFETAVRISTVFNLTYNDIIKYKYVIVDLKGSNFNVPLHKDLLKKLKIYCVRNNISKYDKVFQIDKNFLYDEFKFVSGKARIKKGKFKPHSIRALSIKTLLNVNDIEFVMGYAGHKHIETTKHYTKRSFDEIKQKTKVLEDISKNII